MEARESQDHPSSIFYDNTSLSLSSDSDSLLEAIFILTEMTSDAHLAPKGPLKPVAPNFFYRTDTTKPKPFPAVHGKRKIPFQEDDEGARGGVPWMLGRPAESSRASIADGFHARSPKRRRVMGEVDTNTPVKAVGKGGLANGFRGKKEIPLFMPSPSPTKKAPRNARPVGEADQSIRELLEGLDDPDIGLFDDVLDSPIKVPPPRATETTEEPEGEAEELTMHDWMNVGEAKPSTEALKEEDEDSEYADDFDYDAIDLDVLATASDPGHATETRPIASTYPLPHPPIHGSDSEKYTPVPWARCLVETVAHATPVANPQFHSGRGDKLVVCRVVESVASSGSSKVEWSQGSG